MPVNSLSELLIAYRIGQTIEPETFKRIVFPMTAFRASAQEDEDEMTAGLLLPHLQEIQEAMRVLDKAMDVNPDEVQVLDWFRRQKLPFASSPTPAELVAAGHTNVVLQYLDSIESGASG
jgi:hypothetical protein